MCFSHQQSYRKSNYPINVGFFATKFCLSKWQSFMADSNNVSKNFSSHSRIPQRIWSHFYNPQQWITWMKTDLINIARHNNFICQIVKFMILLSDFHFICSVLLFFSFIFIWNEWFSWNSMCKPNTRHVYTFIS